MFFFKVFMFSEKYEFRQHRLGADLSHSIPVLPHSLGLFDGVFQSNVEKQ
jgi:hypothetical protein